MTDDFTGFRWAVWIPGNWLERRLPSGGVVNDYSPADSSTLDAAFHAAPAPGTPSRELTERQVKHRATYRKQQWDALDARGADLRRGE